MFENLRFQIRKELDTVRRIYDKLDDFLDNRELINVINNHLVNPLSNGYYISFCTDNEVCLKSKKSKVDMFHLLVRPDLKNIETIAIKIISYDGRYEEEIIAQFSNDKDDDRIIVTKKVIEKIVQGKKNKVISIKNMSSIKSYVEKKLRYDYKYETETCFILSQNYSKSSLSEIYIDKDTNAVKRSATIAEDDFHEDPATITYWESNNYDAPPFDDRYIGRMYYYGMSISTKEKFDEFVNSQNNIVTLKK